MKRFFYAVTLAAIVFAAIFLCDYKTINISIYRAKRLVYEVRETYRAFLELMDSFSKGVEMVRQIAAHRDKFYEEYEITQIGAPKSP